MRSLKVSGPISHSSQKQPQVLSPQLRTSGCGGSRALRRAPLPWPPVLLGPSDHSLLTKATRRPRRRLVHSGAPRRKKFPPTSQRAGNLTGCGQGSAVRERPSGTGGSNAPQLNGRAVGSEADKRPKPHLCFPQQTPGQQPALAGRPRGEARELPSLCLLHPLTFPPGAGDSKQKPPTAAISSSPN